MPVAPIELEKEDDPLVLHIPIHTIAIFCNHFFVGIESMTNLNRVVLKELPQFILLFQ
jgi:hypothetical protein